MIAWFVRNPVAANLLMMAILFTGMLLALRSIPVETFPQREADMVDIKTVFRGATPETVELGITLRIEEAIADIEGILEINSRSQEGLSIVEAEISRAYDRRDVMEDIKVRVDALNTIPVTAEKPIVELRRFNPVVVFVVIYGDVALRTLRDTAEMVREQLLVNKQISQVDIQGIANNEIAISVSPFTLDNFNLTLADVGRAIQQGASDVSAGTVQTIDGDILVRSDAQAYSARDFNDIPIVNNIDGQPIRLGDIALIEDRFEEKSLRTNFNGLPAVLLEVRRVGEQSALQVSAETKNTINNLAPQLSSGVTLDYWDDDSEYLQTRITAVLESAFFGGILVMLMLSLLLRPAVAFWVFLGIPVAFMGAFIFIPAVNGSFNVVSLFAFILVIGIVVDDAIVTGENIYRHISEGMQAEHAAIVGTREIAIPVTFGILTTVAAFLPLNFLHGTRYEYIGSQLPMVVIPVLLMSLVESKLILPAHMRHIKAKRSARKISPFGPVQQRIAASLKRFIENTYRPFLQSCIAHKAITITCLLSISCILIAFIYLGHVRFSPFPRVESDTVRVTLTMPETTAFASTHEHLQSITQHFATLQDKYRDENGDSVIIDILSTSGSSGRTVKPNIGRVQAALQALDQRVIDIGANQIGREVRALIGEIPGAKSLGVRAEIFNFNAPINIELRGVSHDLMAEIVPQLRTHLRSYPGLYDIQDNFSGGKEQVNLRLKPRAHALGLRLEQVAQQVRDAVFGFQAQRIQRNREDVRVMVRYPIEYRSSLVDLQKLPIRVENHSEEVLLGEIVELDRLESASTLYRKNRQSVINVTADVEKDRVNLALVQQQIATYLESLISQYPGLGFRFDGESEDAAKTNKKMAMGGLLVLIIIYVLLAIPFKSYVQPLIILSVIPFALIGAVIGHIITFQSLSIISVFGMMALVGVVVNDSLVLVDAINRLRRSGFEPLSAVVQAACLRFRPVLLTSLTTFAGLVPILLDGSQQAKWLKPMATSMGFGILFGTVITLIIVPVTYLIARDAKYALYANLRRAVNKDSPDYDSAAKSRR